MLYFIISWNSKTGIHLIQSLLGKLEIIAGFFFASDDFPFNICLNSLGVDCQNK